MPPPSQVHLSKMAFPCPSLSWTLFSRGWHAQRLEGNRFHLMIWMLRLSAQTLLCKRMCNGRSILSLR